LVTSADVNHNFAIYNSKGCMVGQTQAMPQYTNEMQHLFEEKGIIILCLEYCGIPHAYMFATIHIK
jgi:cytochrome c oxidase subunit 2